jgi:hypothetical protein
MNSTKSPMWDNLLLVLDEPISNIGKIKNISSEEYQLEVKLDNCILYFGYQKYDRYIDSVIGDLTGEYGKEHRILLHPTLEYFLTEDLNLYSTYFNKGPEMIKLISGDIQPFGYIARLLELNELKNFVGPKLEGIPKYNEWYKANSSAVYIKMKEIRKNM